MKRKLFLLLAALVCATASWAQTNVGNDTELRNAITNGANIKVTADIDLSNRTLEIASGTTVTIDLGGHTLDRGLKAREWNTGGQVITVREGATLNLTGGTLKGGWGGNGGGIANEGGNVTLTNVTITGCTGDDRGGGISNHGTLTMTGGSISDNISKDGTDPKGGGGLFNYEGATATLTGVSITRNTVNVTGGGGICNYGTMTLDGCTITGNSCKMNGGGIWTAASATLKMQGVMTVTGNTTANSVTNNLFLKTGAVITVNGSLVGSSITIKMEALTGTFTSGYNTYNSGVDPATIFHPEIPEVMAVTLDGNEAKLGNSLPEGDVYYIDVYEIDHKKIARTVKILHSGEYTLLEGSHEDTDLFIEGGTYVVKGNCFYDGMAYISGDTKIILCDGAKLEIEGSIRLTTTNIQLDVYGQAQNNGVLQNNANINHTLDYTPGIGSDHDTRVLMDFHGGTIKAQGESGRAGISGGIAGDMSQINFYDAIVEARGGTYGPGIGTWTAANYLQNMQVCIFGGIIKAWGGDEAAGIGGGDEGYGVSVSVYGGEVYAYGGDDGAGIGSGHGSDGRTLEVYGGIVKAWGGGNGAGIGSGSQKIYTYDSNGGYVCVYGGEVYAYGGVDAAGIGGGEDSRAGGFEISGGYVYAEGNGWGAGIGGGQDGDGGNVTITGGTVVAKAGRNEEGCRAIGPGEDSDNYGSLTIGDEMMVSSERKAGTAERKNMCWYRTQVRVEVCDHSSGFTYTVDGTTATDHHISHCQYCNHSDTELHTFENGICTVCGVQGSSFSAKLYMPKKVDDAFDGQTYGVTTTHLVVPNSQFRLPMATLDVPGYTFIGWEATTTPTEDTYTSSYNATTEGLYNVGAQYTVTGNICFVARYKVSDINLYDNRSNGETLNEYYGKKVSKVTLSGRTLVKNGQWNTLCLPFDATLTGDLAGATLMELDTDAGSYAHITGFEDGTLYLNFKTAESIVAGKPYIIKWPSGNNITAPTFSNVTINNTRTEVESADGTLVFAGAFSPLFIGKENKNLLYLGANNTLYYPDQAMTIGSCRAHFRLKGIEAGDPVDPSSLVRAFVLNFDDNANGIIAIENGQLTIDNSWFTLSGRKLSGKPSRAGAYINNGKLILMK